MNNEPVAWMYRMKDSQNKWELIFNKPINDEFFETISLYTHPANVDAVNTSEQYVDKTQNNRHDLTDEEILQLWMQKNTLGGAQDIVDFARAILRKAQEK